MQYHILYRKEIIASFEFNFDRDFCLDALKTRHPGFELKFEVRDDE